MICMHDEMISKLVFRCDEILTSIKTTAARRGGCSNNGIASTPTAPLSAALPLPDTGALFVSTHRSE